MNREQRQKALEFLRDARHKDDVQEFIREYNRLTEDDLSYQNWTDRTAIYREELTAAVEQLDRDALIDLLCLCYAGLGLVGEMGEVANQLKKVMRDDGGRVTEARKLRLVDELGDGHYYWSRMLQELGIARRMVEKVNKGKLMQRFKAGRIKGDRRGGA